MSFRRMAAVFEVEGLRMRDKSVLLALAHFENDKTGKCFPSVAAIARAAGCSEKSSQRALKSLKKKQLIEYCGSLGRNPNTYSVKIPFLDNANPVKLTRLDKSSIAVNTVNPSSNPVKLTGLNPINLSANPVRLTPEHRSNLEYNKQEYINKPEPPPPSEASHTARVCARVRACARVREGTPAGAGLAAGVKLVPTFDEAIPDSTPPAWKPWRRIVGAARHSSRNLRVEGFDDLLAIAKNAGRDEAWLLDHLAVLAESGWRDYDGRREAVTIADRIDYLRAVIASEAAGEVVPPSE